MKDIHGGNIWEAASGARPEDILDFSASINPLGPSPKVVKAIKDALKYLPPYPEPRSTAFARAAADFHGISSDEVLAGNGSTEFIYSIPNILRPSSALIIEPAFSEYRTALALSGCRAESLVLKEDEGFSLNLKKLYGKLKNGFDMLFIGNPSNPTGKTFKKEALLDIASACEKYGTAFIVDEAFIDFMEDGSIKREAVKRKNVIVLRSMTKYFSIAGLRLGYVISNKRIIRKLSGSMPPWSVNTLAAAAGRAAFKDSAFSEATLKWLKEEKQFLSSGLCLIPGFTAYDSKANFIMVKTSSGLTAPRLKEALSRKGILIRDLSSFRGLGQRYFRVAVKRRKENIILLEALRTAIDRKPHSQDLRMPAFSLSENPL